MQTAYATKKDLEKFRDSVVDRVTAQSKSDMATWRDIVRNDFTIATEVTGGKIDALEKHINEKLDKKIDRNYFDEFMNDFEKRVMKVRRG